VLRAYWSEEGDIEDLDALARWGEESGLDGIAIRAAAVSETCKQKIELNTEAATARGVFGVPTVDTGSKLYFGNDRLDLLDLHLGRRAGGGHPR
jgi:2-hydroxychromene-2-carboxylate isomerase